MKSTFKLLLAIITTQLISSKVFSQTETIHWYTLEEAQKLELQEPRKILIDIYTDWCGWCKKLDAGAYHDPQIVEYVNSHFYPVKFNAETHDTITFKGVDYMYDPMYRVNMVSPKIMPGSNGYPTTTILDEKLNLLNVQPGYMEIKTMLQFLRYFGDDFYKTMDWTTYQQTN